MRLSIGADHAAFNLKSELIPYLEQKGHTVKDFGTYSAESTDYPDYAHPVSNSVETGDADFGILICGSGEGMCMTANKHAGIRAGLVWNTETAGLIREHNNANVICFGARFVDAETAKAILDTFLATPYAGGRHERRVEKMTSF
ncbi:MAG: ribose 5-phosphate isomerase B [Bacteroidota bacterium]